MTCFQNEYIYVQKNTFFVWCLHCLYRKNKTSNAFSPLCIFQLKVMFRYHFLGHFLAELNEICCGSLLNSILKTYRRKFRFFFYSTKSKILSNFVHVFFTQKTIKNVLCNKSKNASVRFFIDMSSMCVQRFTAFEEAVLKLYVPWWVP